MICLRFWEEKRKGKIIFKRINEGLIYHNRNYTEILKIKRNTPSMKVFWAWNIGRKLKHDGLEVYCKETVQMNLTKTSEYGLMLNTEENTRKWTIRKKITYQKKWPFDQRLDRSVCRLIASVYLSTLSLSIKSFPNKLSKLSLTDLQLRFSLPNLYVFSSFFF